jgi:hypothetical protein
MKLSTDPRFEAYIEDAVATARVRLPPSDTSGDSILPVLLFGVAGITVGNKVLNWGTTDMLALDSLGAAGLAILASLCWLCEPRGKPVRIHDIGSPHSPNRPT